MRTRRKFFWPALTVLTVFFTLSGLMAAFADQVVTDGDIVNAGNQDPVFLGYVAPGATLTPQVSFTLECQSNFHVDDAQSITLTFQPVGPGGSSAPVGGSLTATNA